MINVDHISKSYGSVAAARDISFEVRDGEITTLLGLNGSGKSTTLRAIAGTLRPSSGRVGIDGADPAVEPNIALARVGVFPDQFGLYPRLTVREHLEHIASIRGMTNTNEAIGLVAEQIGLHDIMERRTQGFSEGQRMRTGLAIALLHQPQNVVLDEPTRGLDVLGVRRLRYLLESLRADGRAVLFSSHVLAEVERLADRIVVIHQGQVVAIASPDQLRHDAPTLEDAFTSLTEETAA